MISCSWCGTVPAEPEALPWDWVVEADSRGRRQYCPSCAREHVRSMEAKLDAEYW